MGIYMVNTGTGFYFLGTSTNTTLTEDEILTKDIPNGFTYKKITNEAVDPTLLNELWDSL